MCARSAQMFAIQCQLTSIALGHTDPPQVPIAAKTALASLGGATWRIGLTPIDTFKTTLQVRQRKSPRSYLPALPFFTFLIVPFTAKGAGGATIRHLLTAACCVCRCKARVPSSC